MNLKPMADQGHVQGKEHQKGDAHKASSAVKKDESNRIGASSNLRAFFIGVLHRIENALGHIPRWVLILFFAILPMMTTLVLVRLVLHSSIPRFAPVAYSDAIEYWHEIATFNRVGLNGGYYSYLQNIPAVPTFHFGVHGPVFISMIGIISKIIGWNYATPIYLNMAFIGIAFILFAWLCKLDQLQIIMAGVAVITYWPVLMFMPTTYQESFQQAGGIIVAGAFSAAFIKGKYTSLWKKIVVVLFILILALTRYSWALVLFPLFLLFFPRKKRYTLLSIFLTLTIFCLVVFTNSKISSTGNTLSDTLFREFSTSFMNGVRYILLQISMNVGMFFEFPYTPIALNRLEYIGLMLFVLIDGIVLFFLAKRRSRQDEPSAARMKEDFIVFLVAFPLIAAAFAFYYMTGDYRFFAPLVLFGLLIFVRSKRYTPVLVGIFCSLVITSSFIGTYKSVWSPTFRFDRDSLMETRQLLADYLPYTEDTDNAWCNTIYLPWHLYDYRVAAIPPGIGVSCYYRGLDDYTLDFPFLARYLWITTEEYQVLAPENAARLQKIADMPAVTNVPDAYNNIGTPAAGSIYLNLDADCP